MFGGVRNLYQDSVTSCQPGTFGSHAKSYADVRMTEILLARAIQLGVCV